MGPRKATRRLRGESTMEHDNSPFKVIDGGKSKRSGHKATGSGITEKQARFIEGLANGLTNSESYRAAYDTSNMLPSTVHSESSKLASNPKIAARLSEVLAAKQKDRDRRNSMETVKASDRVWRNVWRLAEGEGIPPAVQQSAVALAAKMAGMLTEQVRVENVSNDASAIEKELVERLQKLSRSA